MFLMIVAEPAVPIPRGLVEIDIDPAAERYAVLDRKTMSLIYTGIKPAFGNAKIITPHRYTATNDLMALILDDTGQPSYFVAGNDKVQALHVDARLISLNP